MPRLSKPLLYASPEECERAFYEALQNADLDAISELWLNDDEVSCVHPGAARLLGYAAVRASWASILAGGGMAIRTLARHSFESPTLAVTSLVEELAVGQGAARQVVHVLASNAFSKTPAGWKMIMHIGMAAPEGHAVESDLPTGPVH